VKHGLQVWIGYERSLVVGVSLVSPAIAYQSSYISRVQFLLNCVGSQIFSSDSAPVCFSFWSSFSDDDPSLRLVNVSVALANSDAKRVPIQNRSSPLRLAWRVVKASVAWVFLSSRSSSAQFWSRARSRISFPVITSTYAAPKLLNVWPATIAASILPKYVTSSSSIGFASSLKHSSPWLV